MKVESGTSKTDVFVLSVWGLFALSFFHPLWLKPEYLWAGPDMGQYLPFKFYWIRSLLEGDPAFWNPYHSLGNPFFATPSVGALSPFNVLYFFLPLGMANTVTYFSYFILAAYGTYRCLRFWHADVLGGFLGGTTYAWSGFFIQHAYFGQDSMVWAAAWIPWIFYFFSLGWEKKSMALGGLSSLCAALAFFEGYPQITYYGLLAASVYGLVLWWKKGCDGFGLKFFMVWGGFFLLLASAQLIPTYFFARISNRADWDWGNRMTDYLSLKDFLLFWNPRAFGWPLDGTWRGRWGHHEIANYIGTIPLFLFLISVFLKKNIHVRSMLLLAVLFSVLSLGESTSLSKKVFAFFYEWVPGFNQHRSIGRMMVITTWAMAVCAGFALTRLQEALGSKRFLTSIAVALAMIELWSYGKPFLRIVPTDYYLNEKQIFPSPIYEKIKTDPDYPRIQPSDHILRNLVPKIGQFATTDIFYLRDNAFYLSVAHDHMNSRVVDVIGLKYVYEPRSERLDVRKWKELIPNHYMNLHACQRAFLAGGYEYCPGGSYHAVQWLLQEGPDPCDTVCIEEETPAPVPSQPGSAGRVRISRYENNRVVLEGEADRPCLLVLMDLNDGFWRAKRNDRPVSIVRVYGGFRGVWIPSAGNFRVEMVYRPWPIAVGMVLSLAGVFLLVAVWFRKIKLTKIEKRLYDNENLNEGAHAEKTKAS